MRTSLFVLTFLLSAAAVRADLIFLKDGTVLYGKTVQEATDFKDPFTNEVHTVKRGFFFIDDGARRFWFSPAQVQNVQADFLPSQDTVYSSRKIVFAQAFRLPAIVEVLETTPFDEKWNRSIRFRSPTRKIYTTQHMQVLNSYFARVDGTKDYPWASFYLTQELGFDAVRRLLIDHPDFHDPADLSPAMRGMRRFRLYHFLVHAGWLNQAESELDRIEQDLPLEKKRVEEAREKLAKLKVKKSYDAIQRADRAGRRKWLAEQLPHFAEKYAADKAIAEVRSLRAAHESADEKVKEAKTFLASLREKLSSADKTLLTPALLAVEAELHAEAIGRLDLFLDQARQAARLEKVKGCPGKTDTKSGQSAGELLSLAVTGWMLGSASAEAKVDMARKVWRGREAVRNYVNADGTGRAAVLKSLDPSTDLSPDQMVQLLSLVPPAASEEKVPPGISAQKTPGGTKYALQLPDEYHHGRSYPVLIVLQSTGETAKDMMDRWAAAAKEEGYILAAPEWVQGGGYNFTSDEHDTVIQTLADLRRRFNADADRVFLFGLGQGGTMAFDLGLAHPDLFAGVLPMSGLPFYFPSEYAANAQYLPFYIVCGEWTGESARCTKDLVEKWIPPGYPVMYVQYKGRGTEWFSGEVPSMFEWMSRKKRTIPATQLGRNNGGEFKSMRTADNRYYWLSSDGILPRHVNAGPPHWKKNLGAASLWGFIKPETNEVFIYHVGHQRVTLSLTRDAKLDFEKPIVVRLNGQRVYNGRVTPSMRTLLDDYAERGDRQKPFVVRISF